MYTGTDAAERVEVVIDRGDAELDRLQVLIREVDIGQHAAEQLALAHRLAVGAVGVALARGVGVGELVLVVPCAAVDQVIDVGTVGTFGVAEHAQRRRREIAAVRRLVRERVFAHEVVALGFVGARGEERRFGEHAGLQRQQIAEDAG
jgi:hypothetical protein